MSTDDKQAYEKSIKNTFLRLHPVTEPEIAMVQFIADHEWKLARAFVYEQGLVAKTRADAKHSFGPDYCDPDERDLIVLGHIQEKNSKAFLNMSGELARVQRVVKASIAEYDKVRRVRELIETAQRNIAMQSIMGKSSDPVVNAPHRWDPLPISVPDRALRVCKWRWTPQCVCLRPCLDRSESKTALRPLRLGRICGENGRLTFTRKSGQHQKCVH